MPKPSFTTVWSRILSHTGDSILTKRGLQFTFEEDRGHIAPSRTSYRIAKPDFGRAFNLVPFDGPGKINAVVRGPSYIWAILHDARIRQVDW